METKRLFIASFVDRKLFERNYNIVKDEFANSCDGKWCELENLHFTYKFLGNVEVAKIPEITDILKDNLIEYESILKFNGLGVFNNLKNPRVLYARVFSPDKTVFQNFKDIESKMVKYGFSPEKGKYTSHITLLRIKKFEKNFGEVFEKNKSLYSGKQKKYKINLVASTLTPVGPIYEIIA